MPSANYLQRPNCYVCIQWDGTNAADIEAQINSGRGYTFSVDPSGNATLADPYSRVYPVNVGDWLRTVKNIDGTTSDTYLPMSNDEFQHTFVEGTTWSVSE